MPLPAAQIKRRLAFHRRKLIGTCGVLALAAASLPVGAQTIFTDGFESGDLSHTQDSFKWASNTATSVISGFAHTGTHSLKFAFPAGTPAQGSWAEQRFNMGANYPELYIEWYAYYPNGTEGLGPKYMHPPASPDNDKLLRLWSGDTSDGNDGYSKFYVKAGASTSMGGVATGDEQVFAEYGENGQGVGPYGTTGSQPNAGYQDYLTDAYRGRWIDIRFHVKVATSANNNGVIEMWRDGVKIFSGTNLPAYPSGGTSNYYNFGYLMGWANSGFAQATNVYIDDVTFSTTGFVSSTSSGDGTTTTEIPNPPSSLTVQ